MGTAQPQLVLLFLSLLFKFYDYKSNNFKKKLLKGVVEGAFMPKYIYLAFTILRKWSNIFAYPFLTELLRKPRL